jgi:K+-transporting ATPase ATPase C chain
MNRLPVIVRQHIAGFRFLIVFVVLCGLIYPLVMVGFAQAAFHNKANGSLVSYNGRVVGSGLLCQEFVDAKGNPLPQYFQPRPSDAVVSGEKNDFGCDPLFSSASNLGPTNPQLIKNIQSEQKAISAFDHVPISQIPPDAVTTSGSGLDPDITPANAYIQVDRVAAARHLPADEVRNLVTQNITGRTLGFLGEPTVNVLTLNILLDELSAKSG